MCVMPMTKKKIRATFLIFSRVFIFAFLMLQKVYFESLGLKMSSLLMSEQLPL